MRAREDCFFFIKRKKNLKEEKKEREREEKYHDLKTGAGEGTRMWDGLFTGVCARVWFIFRV